MKRERRWRASARHLWLGLALAGAVPPGGAAQEPEFPVLPDHAPAGVGDADTCTVPDVDGPVRCGVFRVDEDGEPGGRTLDLHFMVLAAKEGDPEPDAVVFFTGGPGSATLPAVRGLGAVLDGVRARRDLLLVDLRGTGLSGPLDCDVGYPNGLASRFGTLFPPAHIDRCRAALSERADLRTYTTPAAVDDVEALRRWLGYEQVDLVGGSYGTRVAQVYMRRYPEAVRVAVLNGVTPVDRPGYVGMARNLQDALDRLVAECESQDECRAAYPELRARLDALLARFEDGPVEVTVQGETVPFSGGDLGYALRGLLYGRAADIPWMVDRAAGGDLDPLVEYYVQRTGWVGSTGGGAGSHLAAICVEDIDPVTDADVRRATAGTFLGDHVIRSYRDACDRWPDVPLDEGFFEPVRSAIPTLLLSGERDPATPPEGGERVARSLSRSLHVVVPNGGHGVFNRCTVALMTRFVEAGSLDAVDPSCVEAAPPTRFRLPDP